MSDLISRQAVLALPRNKVRNLRTYEVIEETINVKDIENLPSVQPERIKGNWIDAVIPNDSGGLPVIVCDKCNTFFPLQFGDGHNFCPNCGADMREEELDETD